MDLSKIEKIYMIGIKGVGMTMLAQYLSSLDLKVSGSDVPDKYMTDEVLKNCGIKVIEKFDKSNLPKDADVIIHSSAYTMENNVELEAALTGKIKVLTYAEALGEVFNQKFGIAVVGSHGKTTTTAWLGFVMEKSGLKPNVMVGAAVPQYQGCSLVSQSDYLVIEADEYQNKLQYFQPKAVILNNIDYDHPDFFATAADYENVFIEFIKKIPPKGFLVVNFDDRLIKRIAFVNCKCKVITFAIDEAADYVAYDLKADNGRQYFKVKLGVVDEADEADEAETGPEELGDFTIDLPGRHNVLNALAVIAASVELGIGLFKIRKHLEEFQGAERRMQYLGEFRGAAIIDDYAHHPTEVKAAIGAARQKYGAKKLIVAFHPHTFTRTKVFLNDFAESFSGADELIILDIYGSAREAQGGVHSRDLVEKIKINSRESGSRVSVKYIPNLKECEAYLREHIEKDDVVLLMGAGDIFRVGQNLTKTD